MTYETHKIRINVIVRKLHRLRAEADVSPIGNGEWVGHDRLLSDIERRILEYETLYGKSIKGSESKAL